MLRNKFSKTFIIIGNFHILKKEPRRIKTQLSTVLYSSWNNRLVSIRWYTLRVLCSFVSSYASISKKERERKSYKLFKLLDRNKCKNPANIIHVSSLFPLRKRQCPEKYFNKVFSWCLYIYTYKHIYTHTSNPGQTSMSPPQPF